jgi:hypothetical protein
MDVELGFWKCLKCSDKESTSVAVYYEKDLNDDTLLEIAMVILYRDVMYDITLNQIEKLTNVSYYCDAAIVMIVQFPYLIQITPETALDKLKNILTFS